MVKGVNNSGSQTYTSSAQDAGRAFSETTTNLLQDQNMRLNLGAPKNKITKPNSNAVQTHSSPVSTATQNRAPLNYGPVQNTLQKPNPNASGRPTLGSSATPQSSHWGDLGSNAPRGNGASGGRTTTLSLGNERAQSGGQTQGRDPALNSNSNNIRFENPDLLNTYMTSGLGIGTSGTGRDGGAASRASGLPDGSVAARENDGFPADTTGHVHNATGSSGKSGGFRSTMKGAFKSAVSHLPFTNRTDKTTQQTGGMQPVQDFPNLFTDGRQYYVRGSDGTMRPRNPIGNSQATGRNNETGATRNPAYGQTRDNGMDEPALGQQNPPPVPPKVPLTPKPDASQSRGDYSDSRSPVSGAAARREFASSQGSERGGSPASGQQNPPPVPPKIPVTPDSTVSRNGSNAGVQQKPASFTIYHQDPLPAQRGGSPASGQQNPPPVPDKISVTPDSTVSRNGADTTTLDTDAPKYIAHRNDAKLQHPQPKRDYGKTVEFLNNTGVEQSAPTFNIPRKPVGSGSSKAEISVVKESYTAFEAVREKLTPEQEAPLQNASENIGVAWVKPKNNASSVPQAQTSTPNVAKGAEGGSSRGQNTGGFSRNDSVRDDPSGKQDYLLSDTVRKAGDAMQHMTNTYGLSSDNNVPSAAAGTGSRDNNSKTVPSRTGSPSSVHSDGERYSTPDNASIYKALGGDVGFFGSYKNTGEDTSIPVRGGTPASQRAGSPNSLYSSTDSRRSVTPDASVRTTIHESALFDVFGNNETLKDAAYFTPEQLNDAISTVKQDMIDAGYRFGDTPGGHENVVTQYPLDRAKVDTAKEIYYDGLMWLSERKRGADGRFKFLTDGVDTSVYKEASGQSGTHDDGLKDFLSGQPDFNAAGSESPSRTSTPDIDPASQGEPRFFGGDNFQGSTAPVGSRTPTPASGRSTPETVLPDEGRSRRASAQSFERTPVQSDTEQFSPRFWQDTDTQSTTGLERNISVRSNFNPVTRQERQEIERSITPDNVYRRDDYAAQGVEPSSDTQRRPLSTVAEEDYYIPDDTHLPIDKFAGTTRNDGTQSNAAAPAPSERGSPAQGQSATDSIHQDGRSSKPAITADTGDYFRVPIGEKDLETLITQQMLAPGTEAKPFDRDTLKTYLKTGDEQDNARKNIKSFQGLTNEIRFGAADNQVADSAIKIANEAFDNIKIGVSAPIGKLLAQHSSVSAYNFGKENAPKLGEAYFYVKDAEATLKSGKPLSEVQVNNLKKAGNLLDQFMNASAQFKDENGSDIDIGLKYSLVDKATDDKGSMAGFINSTDNVRIREGLDALSNGLKTLKPKDWLGRTFSRNINENEIFNAFSTAIAGAGEKGKDPYSTMTTFIQTAYTSSGDMARATLVGKAMAETKNLVAVGKKKGALNKEQIEKLQDNIATIKTGFEDAERTLVSYSDQGYRGMMFQAFDAMQRTAHGYES